MLVGGLYQAAMETLIFKFERIKISKLKQEFDEGQIVMARQMGQSFSQTAAFVECLWSAVDNTFKKYSRTE